MNNREKLNKITDPNSAEWAQWFGASVALTVVASVVSSLSFAPAANRSSLLPPAKLHDQHL